MFALELHHITKHYGQGNTFVEALKPTDFTLKKGEFAAIIGPSGSGKTTLLTILGQLQSATSGTLVVNGRDTAELSEKERTTLRFDQFGFILQASNLIPFLTVKEQFDLVDQYSTKEKLNRSELIDLLDLHDTLTQYPHQLSGGQRQRVAIARALYNSPDIILADEPTASLDTQRAQTVVALLKQVAVKYNKSVVMITHDTRLLAEVDSIYHMQDGILTKQA